MRWPWKQEPPVDDSDFEEARKALMKARADQPRYSWIVAEHRRKQEENRFGPTVHNALALPRREQQ